MDLRVKTAGNLSRAGSGHAPVADTDVFERFIATVSTRHCGRTHLCRSRGAIVFQ
jgi:hypothetical protein